MGISFVVETNILHQDVFIHRLLKCIRLHCLMRAQLQPDQLQYRAAAQPHSFSLTLVLTPPSNESKNASFRFTLPVIEVSFSDWFLLSDALWNVFINGWVYPLQSHNSI